MKNQSPMGKRISDELKTAITEMPEKEKDKLLIRLVSKEPVLMAKLKHQLLEDEVDMEQQRDKIMQQIVNTFSMEGFTIWNHTPGLVMMVMRDFSGDINHHVKVTKDKYGEIMLLTRLVNIPFREQHDILVENQHRADKFAAYACRKAQIVFEKLKKFNRDYYLDFEKEVNEMLKHLQSFPPSAKLMGEYRLPKRWEI